MLSEYFTEIDVSMTFRFGLMGLNGMASLTARRVGHCVNTSSRTERKRITLSRRIHRLHGDDWDRWLLLFVCQRHCRVLQGDYKHCQTLQVLWDPLSHSYHKEVSCFTRLAWRRGFAFTRAHCNSPRVRWVFPQCHTAVTAILPPNIRYHITTGTRSSSITVIPSDDCSCRSQHAAIIHVGRAC